MDIHELMYNFKIKCQESNNISLSTLDINLPIKNCFQEIGTSCFAHYLPYVIQVSEEYFKQCFHVDMWLVEAFLFELHLKTGYLYLDDRLQRVPFTIQTLATLSFMAHGHFEYVEHLDAFVKYSRKELMCSVPRMCELIVHFMAPSLIRFPHNQTQLDECRNGFLKKHNIPGVVGVIDTFHVRIGKVPLGEEQFYMNRKGHLCIKVQLICDYNNKVLDVNPRHPGADSDVYVWKHSHVREIMLNARAKCSDKRLWLIGDRGYKLSSILINPYRNAVHPQNRAFNQTINSLQSATFGKTFALMCARFSCLAGTLPFDHNISANIVRSCVVLHNYLLSKDSRISEQIKVQLPKIKVLPNARFEDKCQDGACNRNFIAQFLKYNQLRLDIEDLSMPAGVPSN